MPGLQVTRPDTAVGAGAGGGPLLPGGVEKLLALELEVVQLQQGLQIAQLEFETRSAQLHSLKQRADEAEQRAQVCALQAGGKTLAWAVRIPGPRAACLVCKAAGMHLS